MPDEIIPTEKIEVAVPEMKEGKVEFLNKAGFKNPAPEKLKRVLDAMKYTFTSLIGAVAGTDLFTGYQSKVTCFILAICIILCGLVEKAIGVEPIHENPPV